MSPSFKIIHYDKGIVSTLMPLYRVKGQDRKFRVILRLFWTTSIGHFEMYNFCVNNEPLSIKMEKF